MAVLELSTSNGPSFSSPTALRKSAKHRSPASASAENQQVCGSATGSGTGLADNTTDKKSQFDVRKTSASSKANSFRSRNCPSAIRSTRRQSLVASRSTASIWD
jgi:hypothetical protein